MLRPPPPYGLRPLARPDLNAVMAIDRASFPSPRPASFYASELASPDIAHYQVVVEDIPRKGEMVVGFAGYWDVRGEVHISTLAVGPAWQGLGLGKLLLLNLLLLSLEHEPARIKLEVRRSNIAARRLYEQFQFQTIGRQRGYYRDTGEDAILMAVLFAGVGLSHAAYGRWLAEQTGPVFDRLAARTAAVDTV